MTPTERNLRAQLDAANIQIRSLERDIRELRVAVDIKTDEIERVRVILGPTAGLCAENQAMLNAVHNVPWDVMWRDWSACDVWPNDELIDLARIARRSLKKDDNV